MFDTALTAGANAAGQSIWGWLPGARADALVLDPRFPALLGMPPSHSLEALVFAGSEAGFSEVLVAGRIVMRHGRHDCEQAIAERYSAVMDNLWAQA